MNKDYSLTFQKPQDWHCHLRDGDSLARTVSDTSGCFSHALVMPNLRPPVVTIADALAYRDRINAHHSGQFTPCMTLYLTDQTSVDEIEKAHHCDAVFAVKLYPAGATTNSQSGVQNLHKLYPVFEAMQKYQLPLCIHGEVTDPTVDIFDREAAFIDSTLNTLTQDFPALKIVLEHITTAYAAAFIAQQPDHVCATITAHHLWKNRTDMLAGGIKPHLYCLPILKRETDRQALLAAATSGNPSFFLGTDSAPHTADTKESACGCAGIYTAHAALPLYAQAFDEYGQIDKLPDFASQFGARFYGITPSSETITLYRETWKVPETLTLGPKKLVPFEAGSELQWQVRNDNQRQ